MCVTTGITCHRWVVPFSLGREAMPKRRKTNRYQHNPGKDRILHATLVQLRGMSAREVAEITGVSIATVYNWRRLKFCPRSSTFHMVLTSLGKTIRIVDDDKG